MAIALVGDLEDGFLVAFCVESFDDALRVERFFGNPRDIAHRGLDTRAVATERPVDELDQPRDRRRQQQHEGRQLPVVIEEHADQAEDGQGVADHHRHGVRGGFGDPLDVQGEA